MVIEVSRRGLLAGFGAVLIAARAIVRISSLMVVKAMPAEEVSREIPLFTSFEAFIPLDEAHARMAEKIRLTFMPGMKHPIHSELMRGLFEFQVKAADLERLEILGARERA